MTDYAEFPDVWMVHDEAWGEPDAYWTQDGAEKATAEVRSMGWKSEIVRYVPAARLDELQGRLEAALRDAERYRWLRTAGAWDSEIGLNILSERPDDFDAAVDAAMYFRA